MPAALRLYRSLDEVGPDFGPCALSIGNFDGVHRGHREIFRRLAALGRQRGWTPSVMTFHPHPARVVAPARAPRLLSTPEQRAKWMAEAGIRQVLILPFDVEFSRQSPEEFVRRILVEKLDARAVLVGPNFRFGNLQAGDAALLSELGRRYGFLTEVISRIHYRGQMVSSSEVRHLIESGGVARATRLLGRPHFLEGGVVSGQGIGARRTVPTLNLATESETLPARGVYVTRTTDLDRNQEWPSVTNVGFRPTFHGDELTIESHLLGNMESPPPRRIRVEFLRRLRPERKFPDADALKAQILRDADRARSFFRRLQRWTHPPGRSEDLV